MMCLDIPYRAENLTTCQIADRIEDGIRPTFLPDVQKRIQVDSGLQDVVKIFNQSTEKDVTKRLTSASLSEKLELLSQQYPLSNLSFFD